MDTGQTAGAPRIGTLQVVFKIVERCNINCSYCYYFNMGDDSPMSRPERVDPETVQRIAAWLAEGCRDLGIPRVLISLHGGEPMMIRPQAVSSLCRTLRTALEPDVRVGFVIQTNGTILSDAWLDVLAEHEINVGVSLDGDRAANDRFRRDHRGRSTFDRIERNMRRLMDWAGDDPRRRPSTISVLDWRNDYRAVYRYLRGLGVRQMSFLLPDRSLDHRFAGDGETAQSYGKCLSDILDAWLEEDDPGVSVRQIGEFTQHFRAHVTAAPPADPDFVPYQIVVMQSDGTATLNDSYIPALDWYRQAPARRVEEASLREFMAQPVFAEIASARTRLANRCRACMWVGICKGGDLENRFSKANGFDNPSAYCDGYQAFYEHACGRMLSAGYPIETMRTHLEATLPQSWS